MVDKVVSWQDGNNKKELLHQRNTEEDLKRNYLQRCGQGPGKPTRKVRPTNARKNWEPTILPEMSGQEVFSKGALTAAVVEEDTLYTPQPSFTSLPLAKCNRRCFDP